LPRCHDRASAPLVATAAARATAAAAAAATLRKAMAGRWWGGVAGEGKESGLMGEGVGGKGGGCCWLRLVACGCCGCALAEQPVVSLGEAGRLL